MPYSKARLDLAKIPEGPMKELMTEFGEKHNAFVETAEQRHKEIKDDLDQITGKTQAEKAEMHSVFSKIRLVVNYLHGKRFNITLMGIQAYLLLGILRQFGVSTEQVSQLMDVVLKILNNYAGGIPPA